MSEQPVEHRDPASDERVIRSLSDRSGVDVGKVRALFRYEFSRLRMGAKVGSYLAVLTAANVRGLLRRRAEAARAAQDRETASPQYGDAGPRGRIANTARTLHRWEDDGGGSPEHESH